MDLQEQKEQERRQWQLNFGRWKAGAQVVTDLPDPRKLNLKWAAGKAKN